MSSPDKVTTSPSLIQMAFQTVPIEEEDEDFTCDNESRFYTVNRIYNSLAAGAFITTGILLDDYSWTTLSIPILIHTAQAILPQNAPTAFHQAAMAMDVVGIAALLQNTTLSQKENLYALGYLLVSGVINLNSWLNPQTAKVVPITPIKKAETAPLIDEMIEDDRVDEEKSVEEGKSSSEGSNLTDSTEGVDESNEEGDVESSSSKDHKSATKSKSAAKSKSASAPVSPRKKVVTFAADGKVEGQPKRSEDTPEIDQTTEDESENPSELHPGVETVEQVGSTEETADLIQ